MFGLGLTGLAVLRRRRK
ncbi:MAG: hypothetical protein LBH00_05790 [Planctomycetaceae bacterium]|nr:hypothetical protein [Planctomycetaceae bacterium]